MLAFALTIGLLMIEMGFRFVKQVERMTCTDLASHRKFLEEYSRFRIVGMEINKVFDNMAFINMGFGFLTFVSANVGTLKLFGKIPFRIYWLLPFTSFVCGFVVLLIMPKAVQFHTRCDVMLKQRVKNIAILRLLQNPFTIKGINSGPVFMTREWKIILKAYKSIKPWGISCGPLYPLKSGSEAQYFHWVLIRTADVLLLKIIRF